MEEHRKRSYQLFLIAFGFISIIFFTLVLIALGFATGHTLTPWHFPAAVLLAILVNFIASRFFFGTYAMRSFVRTTAIILGVTIVSIVASAFLYDVSGDGQMYHLEGVYQYKTGWNPFQTQLPNFSQAIFINHYAKGAEAPQAAIYALTGKIQTGKATNIMLVAASFLLCVSLLYRLNCFSLKKKIFISTLFAFNPITMFYLPSTCVDGQLASLLLSLLVICCFLFIETNIFFLFFLAFVMAIIVNIKFTGIVFAAIFALGFLTILLINKKKIEAKKVFLASAASAVIGIGVLGYYPYVTNTIAHNDPFYPGVDVLQRELAKLCPTDFQHMNRFGKFFTSFFAHTDDLHLYWDKNPKIPLKLPFTFNKTDIWNASKPFSVLMAGMGPFFSGAMLLSLILFAVLAWKLPDRRLFMNLSIAMVTILVSIFLISEAWWVRFVPQLWLIPLMIAMVSEFVNIKWVNTLRAFFYIVIIVTISFTFLTFPYYAYKTIEINYQLSQLKASHETISVDWTFERSNRVRFYENNIPFKEENVEGDSVAYIVSSFCKYIPPKNIPYIPKPLILKWGDAIRKKVRNNR